MTANLTVSDAGTGPWLLSSMAFRPHATYLSPSYNAALRGLTRLPPPH